MKVVRVKCVRKAPGLRVIPHVEKTLKEPHATNPSEVDLPNLLPEVVSLCEKCDGIYNQVGRILNMNEDEFDRDKAIGLYQRVAVLRATGLVLFGKMDGSANKDDGALSVVAQTCKAAKRMMTDLEDRLKNG